MEIDQIRLDYIEVGLQPVGCWALAFMHAVTSFMQREINFPTAGSSAAQLTQRWGQCGPFKQMSKVRLHTKFIKSSAFKHHERQVGQQGNKTKYVWRKLALPGES